jgi:hypothetical protein
MLTALSLSSCAVPITRTDHVILLVGQKRSPDCTAVGRIVRDIALSLGYTQVVLPPSSAGRIRAIASYRRGGEHILLYLWDGSCVVHADELQRTVEAFRSRGVAVSIEARRYPDMLELIPFAP